MFLEKAIFYIFSIALIACALMVITSRNSVKAVLFLVAAFFSAAVIWMLLQAEFLSIVLVLVYVGAVMVLFLFVVMMLDIDYAKLKHGFTRYLPFGIVIAFTFFAGIYWIISGDFLAGEDYNQPVINAADHSNVKELGKVLYTEYFYPFEIAGMILLVAIIAAISLAFRGKRSRKSQEVGKQVAVKKAERIKIVQVKPVGSDS